MTVEAPLGTAERLVEEQRGVCAMCQEPLDTATARVVHPVGKPLTLYCAKDADWLDHMYDIRRRGWGGFAH